MVNELDKRQYMMSKLGKRITQMIGLFVNGREEEGMNYTREDIINGIKSSTDILARKYPAVTDKFICNCVDYFIKKYGNDLSFLMEGRRKKSNIINEIYTYFHPKKINKYEGQHDRSYLRDSMSRLAHMYGLKFDRYESYGLFFIVYCEKWSFGPNKGLYKGDIDGFEERLNPAIENGDICKVGEGVDRSRGIWHGFYSTCKDDRYLKKSFYDYVEKYNLDTSEEAVSKSRNYSLRAGLKSNTDQDKIKQHIKGNNNNNNNIEDYNFYQTSTSNMPLKYTVNESQLRRIISESVKKVLNEIGYNQFSDDDFGGSGDPYGMVDSDMEETNDSLDGYYDTFNNISVRIMNDGKPDVSIEVSTKRPNNGDKKVSFNGEKAQMLIDKIKDESEEHGNINISMYRNLYKYVL